MLNSVCHVRIGVFGKAAYYFVNGTGKIVTRFVSALLEVLNAY